METYHGHVQTPADAIILFEACRLGLLPRVQRRLSEKERQNIKSGSVFVWDEREAGMRRWTDGKSWSASRVSGSFLTYREMEGKRGGGATAFAPPAIRSGKSPNPENSDSDGMDLEGPDGYRYKPDGLMKQSFSITTATHQKLHLISYYARSHPSSQNLIQPTQDPTLKRIRPAKGMYPESTVHEQQNVPVVTRTPMVSSMPAHNSPVPAYARTAHGLPYPVPQQQPQPQQPQVVYGWTPGTPPTDPRLLPQYTGLPPPTTTSMAPQQQQYSPAPFPQAQHGQQSNSGSPRMFHDRPALPQPQSLTSTPPSHRGSMGSPMMLNRSPRAQHVQVQQQRLTPPLPLPQPNSQTDAQQRYASPASSVHSRTPPRAGSECQSIGINPLKDNVNGVDMDRSSLDVQDIPNEKLGFREDMRALRVLDRAFAL